MKHILVIGGAGYIGSVLVGQLLENGYKVRVLDRFLFGGESLLSYQLSPHFEIFYGDIRDKKIVRTAMNGIDSVVHLAALVGDPACKVDENVTKQINVDATEMLVKESQKNNVKQFIFSSTCSNYGVTHSREEADENFPLNPLSLYAKTKIEAENIVLSSRTNTFTPVVFRFATIFGLSPRMRFNLLVNEFARECATDGRISIRNKDAWRPYLHTLDAASAILTILQPKYKKISDIFNLVSENVQKETLAKMAKKRNRKITLTIESGRLDDMRDYAVSAQKFKKLTKWKPQYNIQQGFDEIVDYLEKHVFLDPYEERYNAWIDEKVLKDRY